LNVRTHTTDLLRRGARLPWRQTTDLLAIFQLAFGISPAGALRAISVMVKGKRQRAWNQLCALASRHPRYYETWIRQAEPDLAASRNQCGIATGDLSPLCLVLDCAEQPDGVGRTVASLRRAFGAQVEIYLDHGHAEGCGVLQRFADEPTIEAIAAVMNVRSGGAPTRDWVLAIRAGDLMSSYAGKALDRTIANLHEPIPLFWDEDSIVDGQRCAPWLKGEFDEWLFLSRDCLGGACLLPASSLAATIGLAVSAANGSHAMAELIIAGIAKGALTRPKHVPLILTHRHGGRGFVEPTEWAALITRHWNKPLQISPGTRFPAFLKVAPAPPAEWPSVSIIIPTRDRAGLLAACLTSLEKLEYGGRCEIIVVDNGSTELDAIKLIEAAREQGRIRVMRHDGPFNFSVLNNLAARDADGQILCLMNNDVTAIDGQWLTNMVLHALDPSVGAVGARLLYPCGSIQHAGVVVGVGGAAGHVAKGAAPDEPAHASWHGVTRTVSAVTAACLVVRREAYLSAGGLDEEAFPVAFNDIDFCLRLLECGLVNRFVAEAELTHHESVSRGDDLAPENRVRFSKELEDFKMRWRSSEYKDPWYSPLFSRSSEACTLQF
jgi:GT2 family glycosyltransferase